MIFSIELQKIIAFMVVLVFSVVFHEVSHGWVAYKLGDPTAKQLGRLTLNPLPHIDPMGTILVPLFIFFASRGTMCFGAAKPVPINIYNLKNPRRDMMWIGASGPLSNILLAVSASLILKILPSTNNFLGLILYIAVLINLILASVNLIPLPPLDGSRILAGLLPRDLAIQYDRLERWGFPILIGLYFLGFLQPIVGAIYTFLRAVLGFAI